MTLLSKKDHDMVIKSLDFYLFSKGADIGTETHREYQSLLDWVVVKKEELSF